MSCKLVPLPVSIALKIKLFNFCLQEIEDKNTQLKLALTEAQASVNSETKSTAGDKHDTSRAMAQIEVENLGKQVKASEDNLIYLTRIDPSKSTDFISVGSLIETSSGYYFLTVGLGRIEFENQSYFIISSQSPIGKLFLGKKKGDEINFNNQKIKILNLV